MNTASAPAKESMALSTPSANGSSIDVLASKGTVARLPLRNLLCVPAICAIGIGIHLTVMKNDPEPDTRSYTIFLGGILGLSILMSLVQCVSSAVRRWMADMHPIVAGAVGLLCVWELVTSGFRWLPLPYFPSPASVLRNLLL